MVVEYASGAEGSCMSFFTLTPRVLLKLHGSVIPLVMPQILIGIGLSFLALHLEDTGQNPFDAKDQPVSLGILLSFLIVFKTQNSFGQFWQALDYLDGVMQSSRALAMTCCTAFDWEQDPDVPVKSRRIVRLLVLHFFVVIEFFERTGANSCKDVAIMDHLREDIRSLAGESEFQMLFPGEPINTPGSESRHEHASYNMILCWIQLAIGRIYRLDAYPAPVMSYCLGQVQSIMKGVSMMNKVDKTQFPFPYEQIVKILVIVWVFTLPFFIVSSNREWTAVVTLLATIGFFGLDEVAEILESPFGRDPNDIFLREYGMRLMRDLEMFYNCREAQLDAVFTEEQGLDFESRLQRHVTKSSGEFSRLVYSVFPAIRKQKINPEQNKNGSIKTGQAPKAETTAVLPCEARSTSSLF